MWLAIADLADVHIVRTASGRRDWTPTVLGVSAIVTAFVSVPVREPWPLMAGVGLLIISLAVRTVGSRDQRPIWTLRATYLGVGTTLYATADRREFDQFCRAVRRALEWRRDQPYRS